MTKAAPRDTMQVEIWRKGKFHPQKVRHKRRPCGDNDPNPPVNLAMVWDKMPRQKGPKWAVTLGWDPVTANTSGAPVSISKYVIEFDHSLDGVNPAAKTRRLTVDVNADTDTAAAKRLTNFTRRVYYRFRVRAISSAGCKGAFSAFTDWQRAGPNAPPTPDSVRIFDKANMTVPVHWHAPNDADDPNQTHPDADHFVVQWSNSPSFAAIYAQHRNVNHERSNIQVPKADLGPFFYARVASVDVDGDRSQFVPAVITAGGNSNPATAPTGVKPGRSRRFSVPFTATGNISVKTYNQGYLAHDDLTIVAVWCRVGLHSTSTHPNDGCPTGQAMLVNLRCINDDANTDVPVFTVDNRLQIPAGKHKDTNQVLEADSGINRGTLFKGEAMHVKVAQVGSGNPGSDLHVLVVFELAD